MKSIGLATEIYSEKIIHNCFRVLELLLTNVENKLGPIESQKYRPTASDILITKHFIASVIYTVWNKIIINVLLIH